MKLTLKIIAKCPRDHWIVNKSEETVIAQKTIEVENLEAVKFLHSEVHKGFFSTAVETYNAVRYGEDIFRLQYDLKSGWVGERKTQFPSQGTYFIDWAENFKRKLNRSDWSVA